MKGAERNWLCNDAEVDSRLEGILDNEVKEEYTWYILTKFPSGTHLNNIRRETNSLEEILRRSSSGGYYIIKKSLVYKMPEEIECASSSHQKYPPLLPSSCSWGSCKFFRLCCFFFFSLEERDRLSRDPFHAYITLQPFLETDDLRLEDPFGQESRCVVLLDEEVRDDDLVNQRDRCPSLVFQRSLQIRDDDSSRETNTGVIVSDGTLGYKKKKRSVTVVIIVLWKYSLTLKTLNSYWIEWPKKKHTLNEDHASYKHTDSHSIRESIPFNNFITQEDDDDRLFLSASLLSNLFSKVIPSLLSWEKD